MTHAAIAALLGCREWEISELCQEHGIVSQRGRKLPPWSELVVELEGASQGAVAARYGVSTSAISQARRKALRAAPANVTEA